MARGSTSASTASTRLLGNWLHSHEEDTHDARIYRRDDYAFPPARGRSGFSLRADGSMDRHVPGPTDRSTGGRGTWQLASDLLQLDANGTASQRYRIVTLEADRLVLRREPE